MEMEEKVLGATRSGNAELEVVKMESEKKGARVVEVEKELEEERRLRSKAEESTKSLREEIEKLVSLLSLKKSSGGETDSRSSFFVCRNRQMRLGSTRPPKLFPSFRHHHLLAPNIQRYQP